MCLFELSNSALQHSSKGVSESTEKTELADFAEAEDFIKEFKLINEKALSS